MSQSLRRRSFLRQSTLVAGSVLAGFPTIIPGSALGKGGRPAPSERLTLGCIGTGNNGINWLRNFMGDKRIQVVAVCDVNKESDGYWADGLGGREPAKRIAEEKYGEGIRTYEDFREVLARQDIDAVQIATPDHWHGIQVILAAQAGKHIYGQKPLSLTVQEGRKMSDAVKAAGVTFQTGSQQRSSIHFRTAIDLVRNGAIGKVHTARVGLPGGTPDFSKHGSETETVPVPEGFNYDFWLGPAPAAPYCRARLPVNWRWLLDYSGGQLTDWGAHHIDIAQWAMGKQLTGPVRFDEIAAEFPGKDSFYNTATKFRWVSTYADGLKLEVEGGGNLRGGVTFEGEDGKWIWVNRGQLKSNPPELIKTRLEEGAELIEVSNNHVKNFIDRVYDGGEPIAPIEAAHRTISIAHVANIGMRLGREQLEWDPKTETVHDDAAANAMLVREMRGEWSLD